MTDRKLLTMSEAAAELGVTLQRVHVLVKTYEIETVRIHARLTMIERKQLDKLRLKRAARCSCKDVSTVQRFIDRVYNPPKTKGS